MTLRAVLLDKLLDTDYSQFYVGSRADLGGPPIAETYAGQENGLVGASVPGYLFCTVTRRRYDYCGLKVELHDSEPDDTDDWEDVVEISFVAPSEGTAVYPWGEAAIPVDLPPGTYRLRYNATGMDPDDDVDADADEIDGGPPLDVYLMQFWPDQAPRHDRILRTTSNRAAYWHKTHGNRRPGQRRWR